MSHNRITVDNQIPDSSGAIAVNLSSYIDEASPASTQVIKYDGSDWINSASPSISYPVAKVGCFFKSSASLSSSGTFSVNDYLMIIKNVSFAYTYNDTYYTFNNATTANTAKNNSNYMESIDIPEAGTYLCICTIAIQNRQWKVGWESNSGAFSAFVDVDTAGNNTGSVLLGVVTTTGADIVRIVIKEMPLGNVSLMRTHSIRGVSVHVMKLS